MNPEFVGRFIKALGPAFEADDTEVSSKRPESENVARVSKIYQAIQNGDQATLGHALADDVELELVGAAESPTTGHWRGRDEVLAGAARNYAQLEDQRPELVAELGSAFLAADLGLYLEPREDHAAYIASWIEVLQNDKRAIVSAAAHAERAVKFLHALQPQEGAP